jgi:hypothetical protein
LGRKPPKLDREIFLDRTHGGRMVQILRDAGFNVNPIREVYPNGKDQFIPDPTWVKLCGERNWVIVTGDKRLETQPENRQAVIDAKARVFILSDSESLPEQWAAAIIVGHYKIQEIIDGNVGPFFASIGLRADSHVKNVRFPRGYEVGAPDVT